MKRILIVGYGDIARRLAPLLRNKYRVYGLIRNPGQMQELLRSGVQPVIGDLDHPASLKRLAGLAHIVIHLAPPHPEGTTDRRSRNLAAALRGRRKVSMLPQRLIYLSTSGVYGDCRGAIVHEERPPHPVTARAARRLDAERLLRNWGMRNAVNVSILRVPGIYATDRLPLERLHKGLPVLLTEEDSHTNHINADDLAHAIAVSIWRSRPGRIYHCVDDSDMKMGDYFDLVADHFHLPRPPRIPLLEAEKQLPQTLLSFMRESRRLDNTRMKKELRIRLQFPTIQSTLVQCALTDQLSRRNSPSNTPR
jgi:nucleoside-diphosphate-sugar epimerase